MAEWTEDDTEHMSIEPVPRNKPVSIRNEDGTSTCAHEEAARSEKSAILCCSEWP